MPDQSNPIKRNKIRDILFAPLGCLLQITNPIVFFVSAIVVLGVCAIAFPGLITDLLSGMTGKTPQFLRNHQVVYYGDDLDPYWEIVYQYDWLTTFSGQVRHTSVINSIPFPLLSHDILVTSGEFSDAALVTTSVQNHHFRWSTRLKTRPEGTINLLHTVPASEEIEILLNQIHKGDVVIIAGQEISRINKMVNGQEATFWHDTGCNSILVTSVEIIHP